MAELEFGDTGLFQQFHRDASCPLRLELSGDVALRDKLEKYEDTISCLKAENQELKRKLKVLSRPSGITVHDSRLDGPLLQILFANNDMSKQFRPDVEDCIFHLIRKHDKREEKPIFYLEPQSSSFVLKENHSVTTSSTSEMLKDAFSVVGSVIYFTSFCLDKLGQPLLNDNPNLTDGWEVPKYQQVFGQVVAADGQELQIKEKRSKPSCFNCGCEDHHLKDCPKPRDMARINEKRKEFSQCNSQNNQRYHEEKVDERFSKYRPGVISKQLLEALGVPENCLPPFIYRMRQLGYPPGWLKEAESENSGLALYDGKMSDAGEGKITEEENQSQTVSYDVLKLIDFPGFNIVAPNVIDEWRLYGSIPMQTTNLKQNFAAYLSSTYPSPGLKSTKRPHELDSAPHLSKKRRSDSEYGKSADVDVYSGSEMPHTSRSSGDFQFQSQLPPGSPSPVTPPPLPKGTPPTTPKTPPLPKGTPPLTPNNCSPAQRGQAMEEELGEEDGLTLEELEEQQRLIWAALESADIATSSDSETPPAGTPSVVFMPMPDDAEKEEEPEILEFPSHSEDHVTKKPLDEHAIDDEVQGVAEHCNDTESQHELITTSENESIQDTKASCATKVISVPHRSKFAEGIIPFEDTSEYRDVAEATGVYLKIRDLLKSSPRNQSQNKK